LQTQEKSDEVPSIKTSSDFPNVRYQAKGRAYSAVPLAGAVSPEDDFFDAARAVRSEMN